MTNLYTQKFDLPFSRQDIVLLQQYMGTRNCQVCMEVWKCQILGEIGTHVVDLYDEMGYARMLTIDPEHAIRITILNIDIEKCVVSIISTMPESLYNTFYKDGVTFTGIIRKKRLDRVFALDLYPMSIESQQIKQKKSKVDRLSWDQYFMSVALLVAQRSPDMNTKVGSCVVKDNHIISTGYNGFPSNTKDGEFPMDRDAKEWLDNKYPYICHSEMNSILNSPSSVRDSIVYVTLFPCNECAKIIAQSGVKEVVYLHDKYNGTNENIASKHILDACGIKYRQLEFDDNVIDIFSNISKELKGETNEGSADK